MDLHYLNHTRCTVYLLTNVNWNIGFIDFSTINNLVVLPGSNNEVEITPAPGTALNANTAASKTAQIPSHVSLKIT